MDCCGGRERRVCVGETQTAKADAIPYWHFTWGEFCRGNDETSRFPPGWQIPVSMPRGRMRQVLHDAQTFGAASHVRQARIPPSRDFWETFERLLTVDGYRHRPKVISLQDALDGPRRWKNTIHESIKVSFNFIEIFRPKRDLNVQFSELYS